MNSNASEFIPGSSNHLPSRNQLISKLLFKLRMVLTLDQVTSLNFADFDDMGDYEIENSELYDWIQPGLKQ